MPFPNRFFLLPLAALLAGDALAAPARRTNVETVADPVVTQMIVKLRAPAPGQVVATASDRIAALSEHVGQRLQLRRAMSGNASVLQLPAAVSPAAARALARRLAQSPQVEYAAPDYRRRALLVPNDNRFAEQWALLPPGDTVPGGANFPAAWDISTGSQATVVAIVDSGVLPHPELAGRLLPGYDFISNAFVANDGNGRDSDASDPGDWVTQSDSTRAECEGIEPEDSTWHGTHVAGIVAAQGHNDSGTAGASWATRILPVRVLGKCGGYDSDIIDAVRWSAGLSVKGVPANPYPADVINLSLGSPTACTAAQQAAFDDIYAAGVTVVAATGNDYADTVSSPANCNHVIAVTAHSLDGSSSSFANVGTATALSAPGGGRGSDRDGNASGPSFPILSLSNSGLTAPSAIYGLAWQSGTSQAAPHVTGTVALLRAVKPGLTPDAIRDLLTATVRPFPADSWCARLDLPATYNCGAGLLDAGRALQAALLLPNVVPEPVTTGIRKGRAGELLEFALQARDGDGDALSFSALALPEGATLSPAGLFRWEAPVAGDHALTYVVSDGEASADPVTVTLRIQKPSSGGGGGGGALSPFLLLLLTLPALRRHFSR